MHIVQIAPSIGSGGGVAGAAMQLGAALTALGHAVENVTASDIGQRRRPTPRTLFVHRLSRIMQSVRFTVTGTRHVKSYLAQRPEAVSICHNAVMAGDVYVNHGVVAAAMQARGGGVWRMLRNPLHAFTFVRDRIRYRGRTHRAIVALTDAEVGVLERVYGRVRPPVTVIPHGVDLERFAPASEGERRAAREMLGLDPEHRVALFIGHELDRKGLPLAIDALTHAPTVMLLVVGGYRSAIARMQAHAASRGVSERVHFVGPQGNISSYLAAADMFVLPSSYESFALVITEALASGVPVIATRVGCAPELIVDGDNGYLVDPDAVELGQRYEQIAMTDVTAWRDRTRASVAHLDWGAIAQRYVTLLERIRAERSGPGHE